MSELINDEEKASPQGNAGRRRFVRGIGVAVPVSLTVSARSALAATCSTVSAHASIALTTSHTTGTDRNQTWAALSPDGWDNLTGTQWNSITGRGVAFSTIFTNGIYPTTSQTMRNVLDGGSQGTDTQQAFAAAYLNLVNFVGQTCYTLEILQAMWAGTYPVGAPLTPIQVMDYLIDSWTTEP